MSQIRSYGNDKTSLALSLAAYYAWLLMDNVDIEEHEEDNGALTYSIRGRISRDNLTENGVNDALESLWWKTVSEQMDNDIREQVRAEFAEYTSDIYKEREVFYARYCKLHEQKYGEPFEIH